MEQKQTAVEWLVDELSKFEKGESEYFSTTIIKNKAIRMEKQQHKKFNDFLQEEIELGISDKATIERIEWYYNTYFINNEQQ